MPPLRHPAEREKLMRKVTRIAIAASALVLLPSCNRAEPVNNAQSGITDTAALEQQIRDIETKWQADYNARNVDALTGHYAEDAALANPGEPLSLDSASRRTVLARIVSDPSLKMQFEADRVLVAKSGELAYSRGEYSMQTVDPVTKNAKNEAGTYVTVWQKQEDGSWKAIETAVIPGGPDAGAAPITG